MRPVLLVIDVQNAWLEMSEGLRKSIEERVDVINGCINLFKEKGLPIVVVHHTDKGKGPEPGTRDFEFPAYIKVDGIERRITKNYPNAFNRTGLMDIIKETGGDTVVLCGLSAMGCVMATYIGALDNDLVPYLLRDGVAGNEQRLVRLAEELFDTLTLNALTQILA